MKKVLIIEDEMDIAELQRDYLEVNGFDSDIASTGEEGLQLANSNKYDLMLIDVMLPGVNGLELCKELRKKYDIPILMVTARKEDIDKIKGFDRGADDYIVKPFNPNELVARVKAHISRYDRLINREKEQETLQIRGLVIHRDSRKVIINKEEKIFTAKEYDLLLFLAENANRVFSKEHLFDRIWGYNSIGDITTVTVHIRKIREKIEEDPSNPKFIETVWGVGYRFKKE
ncbi:MULTISPECIES: response regulator transcription factor [Bacillaceae]|uniref:response regulator transcription factor n=1 Tax=Bacillaceae TaxID=186817 RepID=UPI0010468677|nr:response regulator transcription factor [Bacillus sp. CBEL-1]TDB51059.1 response regulator transcription factor [Bacillus sp. CBEL-1]